MADIALIWDPVATTADFAVQLNDLATDEGLETAVLISLFTDRRAEDGDVLPDGETNRRGWWADALSEVSGDRIGSRLWLLDRSKQTADVLPRAEEYTREALQWMIEDKVCDRIDVAVTFPARGIRQTAITIYRPGRDPVHFKFGRTWEAQAQRSHP